MEQEINQIENNSFETPKKRFPILIPCILGGIVLAGILLFVILGNGGMNKQERMVLDFSENLKNSRYQEAYESCFSQKFKDQNTLESFKQSFSGFTYFIDMKDMKTEESEKAYVLTLSGKIEGKLTRTLIYVDSFDGNTKINDMMLLEVSKAIYGNKIDTLVTDKGGDCVFYVGFNSNVEPNQAFSDLHLKANGIDIAQAAVLSKKTDHSGKKEYGAYFSVPLSEIEKELTFTYKNYEVSLKDLVAKAE